MDTIYNGMDLDNLLGLEWNPDCHRGITMQEFAAQNGISYEAVRRQVSQNREKLYPHMRKENRTQYLDDIAAAFLKEHRRPQTPSEDIQKIQKQLTQFLEAAHQNIDLSERMLELSQENGALQEKVEALSRENQILKTKLEESQALLEKIKSEYDIQSQKQQDEIKDLNCQVTCMKMYSERVDNLVKILSSPHARDFQKDFEL